MDSASFSIAADANVGGSHPAGNVAEGIDFTTKQGQETPRFFKIFYAMPVHIQVFKGCPEYSLYTINHVNRFTDWVEAVASQWLNCIKESGRA